MNFVVIFAAGVGARMNSSSPKQFLKINDKPIIAHTIEKFNNSKAINSIVVVTLKDYIEKMTDIVHIFGFNKVVKIIEGGGTAFSSQFNGLKFINSISKDKNDIVLIHDGVRPFINEELINKCIDSVKEKGSAITVSPAFETVALVNDDGDIDKTVPRQRCLIARAPQAFFVKDLFDSHKRAIEEHKEYIDSASMMLDQGKSLNPIAGPDNNIKITTQYDYLIAKLLLKDYE